MKGINVGLPKRAACRRFVWGCLFCGWATLGAVQVLGAEHSAIEARPPLDFSSIVPAPPGYASPAAVMAAIGLRVVHLIHPPSSLPPGVVEEKDIEYGRVGDRSLRLDLYRPAKITRPVPGLIFIHGGGWSGGERGVYKYYTVRFAKQGYVAVTISYRLSGEAPFPAAVEDAKCAVRWLRANASRYGVDPRHLAVIGGSAGGHLALMVGYSSDVPALEGHGGHPGVSSRVQAVIDFYGPTDLTTDFAQHASPVRRFLDGKTYEQAPELYLEASPLHYLDRGDPPTLVFQGTIDQTVPPAQARLLVKKLRALGVPYAYDSLKGWPHALDMAAKVNAHCRSVMKVFLAKYLPLPGAAR